MGCDIHIFIEWKKGDEPWKADKNHTVDSEGYVAEVDADGRDYNLFAALSGVRGEGPESNGIPDDTTDLVKKGLDWDDEKEHYSDYHSHTHYSLEDFLNIYLKTYPQEKKDLDKSVPVAFDRGNYKLNYLNLLSYCLKKKQEFEADLTAESMLLDQPMNTNVECRLIFCYDN